MGYKTLNVCREHEPRSAVAAQMGESTHPKRPIDWRVERILQFVDTHDGKLGWDLNDLCLQLELGITGQHAAKLFIQETQTGIRQYAKERRLAFAAQQLRDTTDSVKRIALELGYRTPNDLRRQFKKRFSLNPTEFRTVHQTTASTRTDVLPFPDSLMQPKGGVA